MATDYERSEAVVEDYKKHKLATSALRRIHELIRGFEQDRVADVRMACIGVTIIILLLGLTAYFFFGGDNLTLF
ncbi:MAG: hypothetical protein GY802_00245 [Gammaproteobacteria bacterium]|nr:hypothetical protein [Gammaproteobacteria bacterium]